ncbi:hypothetical protein [Flavobacterium inviolabile]|uniref:hypothetical protein n=1 Tax=Flavobacterium inviolabile TaxID=2748320 RepID=UPI0015AEC26B|nr:hypothetical protein [Flavobacterium inviolabile]
MKYLIITGLFIFSFLNDAQEEKMNGSYKMEFGQKFQSENGIIIFNDSIYERKLLNGKKINGKIEYKKFHLLLKDNNSDLQMSFSRKEMLKDTIYFATKVLSNHKVENSNNIIINNGSLIKIKKLHNKK